MLERNYIDKLSNKRDNAPTSIENPEVLTRILHAYRLLIEEGRNLTEIAGILNTVEFTIFCDLTKRLPLLNKIKPNLVTEEMVNNVKTALNLEEEQKDNVEIPENSPYKLLFKMYPTREKRLNFMAKSALAFSLSVDTIAYILGEDKDVIYKELIDSKYGTFLHFLFSFPYYPKEIELANFNIYFERLKMAYLNNDKELCANILGELDQVDKDALEVKKKRIPGSPYKEEDIIAILKYQIKYWLSKNKIAYIFEISNHSFIDAIKALEGKYPELLSHYYYMSDCLSSYRNKNDR